MARIPVYEAPDRLLHTEEKGFAAFETAGRRIGPAYDKAATDVRDIGNLNASSLKERLWPWDILELEQRLGDSSGSGSSRGGGGGGINVKAGGTEHLGSSGSVGRLGRVAADMANEFTGSRGPIISPGKGHLVQPGLTPDSATLTNVPQDPRFKQIISDPRPLSPITFPDKVGESTTIPRGHDEQPADPDAIRRSAERGVFRDDLTPLPGTNQDPGYGGGGFSDRPGGGYAQPLPPWNDGQQIYQDAYPPTDAPAPAPSSFGQQIWNGINAAAEWIGGVAPGTDNPDQPYYATPAPTTEDQ